MVPVPARGIRPVDEGLQLFHQKLKIVVTQKVLFAHPFTFRVLLQLRRIPIIYVLGEIFLASRAEGVCHADHDTVLDPASFQQFAEDFVDAPFLVIEHLLGVEKILAIAHIHNGVLFTPRIILRKPYIHVPGRNEP